MKMLINHSDAKMEGGITRSFHIIDEIKPDQMVFNWDTWREEFQESKTCQRYFAEHLQGLTSADHVNLYINSMGGSVKEGLGIYNELRRCPATVTAYIDGFAASAASIIAMAAEKIIMPRNTCMMIHNAMWAAYGNSADLRKSADDLEVINMAAIQSYMVHAGDKLPADKLQKFLDAETWLTAEDCVTWGLADDFGEEDVDLSAAAEQFRSARASAEGKPEASLFRQAPAAIARMLAEPNVSNSDTTPRAPEAKAPEAPKSSLFRLLESMTTTH